MRKGGGKAKGSSFEREVCKGLSLWLTNGQKADLFWRSAMSGGRATVAMNRGEMVRQSGDITAVSPEGHEFLKDWFIECKHVKSLDLSSFYLKRGGTLWGFWQTACREALRYGTSPMIIAKQNNSPIIVLTKPDRLRHIAAPVIRIEVPRAICDLTLYEDLIRGPSPILSTPTIGKRRR